MSGFSVVFDEARGVLICRILNGFTHDDIPSLQKQLATEIRFARKSGALRFLWDNRANLPFPPKASETIGRLTALNADPLDRTAVLVANSVAKAQSRLKTASGVEIFASENAAFTWLSIGAHHVGRQA